MKQLIFDLTQEEWRPAKAITGLEASSLGRIRYKGRIKPLSLTGKYYRIGRGYLACRVEKRLIKAHQIVASAFLPDPLENQIIDHVNGITTDNRPSNLEWVTNSENQSRAIKNGLRKIKTGEQIVTSKLSESDVKRIREIYPTVKSTRKLAVMFNISKTQMKRIVKGAAWKHSMSTN